MRKKKPFSHKRTQGPVKPFILWEPTKEEQNHAPYGVSYICVECDAHVIPGDPHFEEEVCEECYYEGEEQ